MLVGLSALLSRSPRRLNTRHRRSASGGVPAFSALLSRSPHRLNNCSTHETPLGVGVRCRSSRPRRGPRRAGPAAPSLQCVCSPVSVRSTRRPCGVGEGAFDGATLIPSAALGGTQSSVRLLSCRRASDETPPRVGAPSNRSPRRSVRRPSQRQAAPAAFFGVAVLCVQASAFAELPVSAPGRCRLCSPERRARCSTSM